MTRNADVIAARATPKGRRHAERGASTLEYLVFASVFVIGLVAALGLFRSDIADANTRTSGDIEALSRGQDIDERGEIDGRDAPGGSDKRGEGRAGGSDGQSGEGRAGDGRSGEGPGGDGPGGDGRAGDARSGDGSTTIELGQISSTPFDLEAGRLRGIDTRAPDGRLSDAAFDRLHSQGGVEVNVGVGVELVRAEDAAIYSVATDLGENGSASFGVLGYRDASASVGVGVDPQTGHVTAGLQAEGQFYVMHGRIEGRGTAEVGDVTLDGEAQLDVTAGRLKGSATLGYIETDEEQFVGVKAELSAATIVAEAEVGGSVSLLDVVKVITGNTGNPIVDTVMSFMPFNLGPSDEMLHAAVTQNETVREALGRTRLGVHCKGSVSGPAVGVKGIAGAYRDKKDNEYGVRAGARVEAGPFGLGLECGAGLQF